MHAKNIKGLWAFQNPLHRYACILILFLSLRSGFIAVTFADLRVEALISFHPLLPIYYITGLLKLACLCFAGRHGKRPHHKMAKESVKSTMKLLKHHEKMHKNHVYRSLKGPKRCVSMVHENIARVPSPLLFFTVKLFEVACLLSYVFLAVNRSQLELQQLQCLLKPILCLISNS